MVLATNIKQTEQSHDVMREKVIARVLVQSITAALSRLASKILARVRMSRLTARIMAIMVFPLSIFLVGLLSIDQYRQH